MQPMGSTTITTTGEDKQAAVDYAKSIGGRAVYIQRDGYGLSGGYWSVVLDDAAGKRVTCWSGIEIPEGAIMVRRDSLQPGDVIFSSHFGRREVALYDRGTLRLIGGTEQHPLSETYDADSLIPLVRYGATPQEREHAEVLTAARRDLDDALLALADASGKVRKAINRLTSNEVYDVEVVEGGVERLMRAALDQVEIGGAALVACTPDAE